MEWGVSERREIFLCGNIWVSEKRTRCLIMGKSADSRDSMCQDPRMETSSRVTWVDWWIVGGWLESLGSLGGLGPVCGILTRVWNLLSVMGRLRRAVHSQMRLEQESLCHVWGFNFMAVEMAQWVKIFAPKHKLDFWVPHGSRRRAHSWELFLIL